MNDVMEILQLYQSKCPAIKKSCGTSMYIYLSIDIVQLYIDVQQLLVVERSSHLCAELLQHCQGLKVEEVGPLDVTLLLRIQSGELGQDFLLLVVAQVFVELLLGGEVTVLQQLVRHQTGLCKGKHWVSSRSVLWRRSRPTAACPQCAGCHDRPGMILHCLKVSTRLYISSSVSSRFRLSYGGHGMNIEPCVMVHSGPQVPPREKFYSVGLRQDWNPRRTNFWNSQRSLLFVFFPRFKVTHSKNKMKIPKTCCCRC